ncbi:phycobilisome rod-core linker polypeptide [Moorena sp. SIO3B2]|uniref:phycobilisome rod-core linker polypeptide n=1 Tax=Moorena sp. SIO3B2 TaxID=2607827 RepID=UPI0013C81BA3|nr:phycobilisome rod-core linker polypeptide [Moorena sp. SIO3B2]NEP36580.1 phycobilisome Linker polypeptide [Moorena sp. SIO3B2]
MQTLTNNSQLIQSWSTSEIYPISYNGSQGNTISDDDKLLSLKAVYKQLFKENRDLDFHHHASLESAYLNGQLSTRDLVRELLCSDMYVNYVFAVNSNFRFVALCFERVLGRQATQNEIHKWSSLLASEGLITFAQTLTNCDEYIAAFGDDIVPFRRSEKLSSSNQGLPALPKELSIKRYTGIGNVIQHYKSRSLLPWEGNLPPRVVREIGAVVTVAGTIEVVRVILTIAWQAYSTGSL